MAALNEVETLCHKITRIVSDDLHRTMAKTMPKRPDNGRAKKWERMGERGRAGWKVRVKERELGMQMMGQFHRM